ncbi:MAG: GRP family sugar transporter [Armatimonadota bacterium]
MQQVTGFGLAMLSMVLYSLYMVPRKKSSIPQGSFTFWMGFGILITTFIIGILAEDSIPDVTIGQYLLIIISGIVWGTGTLAYSSAVKHIGLSRSTPIKNTSAILGTLSGIIIFHEFSFRHYVPMTLVVLGSIAIVVSATILSRIESFDKGDEDDGRQNLVFGILASVWAAVAYSAYTVPMKITYAEGVTPSTFLFYMGQGCFVGMTALSMILKVHMSPTQSPWRDRGMAGLSGLMWALGSLCANIAVKYIGVAVTWPLTKNTVIAVVYGTLVLKEIDTARHKKSLNAGLLLSLAGVLLLAIAMNK